MMAKVKCINHIRKPNFTYIFTFNTQNAGMSKVMCDYNNLLWIEKNFKVKSSFCNFRAQHDQKCKIVIITNFLCKYLKVN